MEKRKIVKIERKRKLDKTGRMKEQINYDIKMNDRKKRRINGCRYKEEIEQNGNKERIHEYTKRKLSEKKKKRKLEGRKRNSLNKRKEKRVGKN